MSDPQPPPAIPSTQDVLEIRIKEFLASKAKVEAECSYDVCKEAQEAKRLLLSAWHTLKSSKQQELDKLTSGLPEELVDMINA